MESQDNTIDINNKLTKEEMKKQKRKEIAHRYYEKHKEQIKEYNKQYRQNCPDLRERKKLYQRAYLAKLREKKKELENSPDYVPKKVGRPMTYLLDKDISTEI
jgi:hypothetical protein